MTTAFVLSGGASLGAIQVGMLRALTDHDVRPDLIVGTSVGAVNGAFLACREFDADAVGELAELWLGVRRYQVFPSSRSPNCSGSSARAGTSSRPARCAGSSPATPTASCSRTRRRRSTSSPA